MSLTRETRIAAGRLLSLALPRPLPARAKARQSDELKPMLTDHSVSALVLNTK
jgi:hypothetical protein